MTYKDNILRAIKRDNPQWVPNGMEGVISLGSPVVERPKKAGYDAFCVVWVFDDRIMGGTYPAKDGNTITDIGKWMEQIQIPDVSEIDWEKIKEDARNIDREEYLVMGFIEMGLFERSYLLLGMEEALISCITEPNIMKDILGAIADYKIELISMFHNIAHLDIIWYGDDWGSQSNLFLPEQVWRDLIKPETKRVYDCMKKREIIINQHSCGRIESIFGDMVEMGADIWNPCQPCNDLFKLKDKYGDYICFCGGIDSQFVLDKPGVTAREVRNEVRKRIDDMATGGGYIAAPSHSVPYDEGVVNAMNDEISMYGKEFYKKSCSNAGSV